MIVQYCSDLHLEFPRNQKWLSSNPIEPLGDILVIAGDTYYLNLNYSNLEFIHRVSEAFHQVYLIPGNHEYYGGYDVSTALEATMESIMDNVFMVNNQSIDIEGTKFIFSTMWSKVQRHIMEVMRGMADFHEIKFMEKKLTINQFNDLHDRAWDFLQKEIATEGKKVVVTHHLPSDECNAEEFAGSSLNEAFCVDKTNFILENQIDYWIYGHSHRNLSDFNIGQTKLLTNQLGYVEWGEHRSFKSGKIFKI